MKPKRWKRCINQLCGRENVRPYKHLTLECWLCFPPYIGVDMRTSNSWEFPSLRGVNASGCSISLVLWRPI